jgi:uncharacterized protein
MIISVDTNLLFFAFAEDRPEHSSTTVFINSLLDREEVLLSELILVELYRLLRNPAVVSKPLSASEGTEVIQIWRQHPRWKIIGFPPHSRELHDRLWKVAAGSAFGYRRIYDARLALTLLQYGVTEFATVNVKDFKEFGFRRVWNPLAE